MSRAPLEGPLSHARESTSHNFTIRTSFGEARRIASFSCPDGAVVPATRLMEEEMSESPEPTPNEEVARRRLVAWPLSLLALTAALLLVTQVAAGWGARHHEGFDLEDAKEHAEHAVEHLLERVDASDDQSARIQAIVAEGIDELALAHGPDGDAREAWGTLLTADVIDHDAIESLRREHLARADAMSAIASRRIGEILEILTPEQRLELRRRLERHRGRHRWH